MTASYWRRNRSVNTTLFNKCEKERLYRDYTELIYLLDYPVLLHKKVLFHQWEHSKHLYIHGIPSPHLIIIVNTCTIFHGTRDDKINNCGLFKFSVAHCN